MCLCTRFLLVPSPQPTNHKPLICGPTIPWYAYIKMVSDGANWSKGEINALIDTYSDAKMSADPMTTTGGLYSFLEMTTQVSMTIRANRRL